MLVMITDLKDKHHWINPLYVKSIRTNRKGQTEIIGSISYMGSMIKTNESAESVADRISVAMPDSPAWQAATGAAVLSDEQQRAAAAAAAG
ncbi:MAG: hypothetical protein NXI14_13905 [bacterium]|nr:hypothetical protein [bacterium]